MVASPPGLRSGGGRDQKGGSSLNCPDGLPFEPAPEVLVRSGLAVAHRKLGPISSASTSTTLRRSPSGVSQERALSRPTTITRSPLDRLSVAFSASCRQALTRKKEVSPSFQSLPSRTRGVTATRKLATAAPPWVNFSSGASVRLPQMMVVVSAIVPSLWGSNDPDGCRVPAGQGGQVGTGGSGGPAGLAVAFGFQLDHDALTQLQGVKLLLGIGVTGGPAGSGVVAVMGQQIGSPPSTGIRGGIGARHWWHGTD